MKKFLPILLLMLVFVSFASAEVAVITQQNDTLINKIIQVVVL